MSLEQALKENTAAVRDLIAAMQNTPAAETAGAAKKSTAAQLAGQKQTQEAEQSETDAAPGATPSHSEPVAYEQVKKAFLALINAKGREAGVALLTQHGAAKLPEVKEAEYAAFAAACEKAAA